MNLHLHWYLPTSGDGRSVVGSGLHQADESGIRSFRAPDIDYLAQIARSAEQLGFESLLTPTGTWCEDAWLVTTALTQLTSRIKFLVAFRPGLISPTLAAQQAATFQRISGGRLLLNVVTGGDPAEQRSFGDHLDHDQRYARTAEFLQVLRGAWTGEGYDFRGEHYAIENASVMAPPDPVPPVFFGGASPAALDVAARHVDTYLSWGETPPKIADRVEAVRKIAAEAGRTSSLDFGIRLHVIARPTAEEAWEQAGRLLADITPEAIADAQAKFAKQDSVGQQGMAVLHERGAVGVDAGPRALEIYPNLWAGFGLVRSGAGTALVGSYEEVADRIEEYHAVGMDHFVLSGQPHLEEAYWFGEGVRPILVERGLTPTP